MTKAAKKLFVSQSSLSQSIRLLEENLGTSLFVRSKTSLRPTQVGEYFAFWAKEVLASEQKMRQKVLELSQSDQRKLVIGISAQRRYHLLKYVLPKFYERSKNCKIIFHEHNSRELYNLLQKNIIEFVVDFPHPEWAQHKETLIFNERMLIAAPASIEFETVKSDGKFPSISTSQLADKPFILLAGHEHYKWLLNDIFSRIGSSPNVVMECVNPEIAFDMVSEQVGMLIVSEFELHNNGRPNVRYYTLADYPLIRQTSITYPQDRILSDDAKLFISILQEECDKLTVLLEEKTIPNQ